jgi:hypothetical protein
MLRSLGTLCLALLALGLTSSKSQAQLHDGDLRLYIDSGFVTWDQFRQKGDTAAGDALVTDTTTSVDLFGHGGLGLAYVVNKYLVPGLYFNLHRVKAKHKEEIDDNSTSNSGTMRTWELRPYLEIPFNASSRFVVHGTVGLSLGRQVNDDDDNDGLFGVGPVAGLGAHGFITNNVSLDLGLMFRALFIKSDDLEDAREAGGWDDPKFRQLSLLFTVGASYWL